MLDSTKETLSLFIEEADLLEKTRFFNYLRNGKPLSFSLSQGKDNPFMIEIIGPDEEDRNSALTIIRKFTSQEPISIREMTSLCIDPGLSDNWKKQYLTIREENNSYLNTCCLVIEDQDLRITRWELFDTFINGKIFHVKDAEKRKKYLKWKSDDVLFGLLSTEMNSILDFLCLTITTLSTITKAELSNNP